MAFVIANSAKRQILKLLTNQSSAEDLVLRLYSNDKSPHADDTADAYTEAAFSGYTPITLSASNWAISGDSPELATHSKRVFTCTGQSSADAVYGYYVTGSTSGNLYWAEKFVTLFSMQNNGDKINITLTFAQD